MNKLNKLNKLRNRSFSDLKDIEYEKSCQARESTLYSPTKETKELVIAYKNRKSKKFLSRAATTSNESTNSNESGSEYSDKLSRNSSFDNNRDFLGLQTINGNGKKLIYAVKNYSSGDRYEGYLDTETGKREGFGLYIFSNGDRYKGKWQTGKMHGQGVFVWANSDNYFGEWYEGSMTGHGVKSNIMDGSSIEGYFLAGEANGWCKKIYACGDIFQGYCEGDKRHGYGEYKFTIDNSKYCGNWNNDLMDGLGEKTVITQFNSDAERRRIGLIKATDFVLSYKGYYKNSLRCGQGIGVFWDGSVYTGEWCNNQMHGYGKFQSDDGTYYYEGSFRENLKDGYGCIVFPIIDEDFLQHSVDFVDSDLLIELILAERGGSYQGQWVNDQPQGFGLVELPNGQKYAGKFFEGKVLDRETNDQR
jgi:hypothetical protein